MTASDGSLVDPLGWPPAGETLDPIRLLREHARRRPDETALLLVDRDGRERRCTWFELDRRTRCVAANLRRAGASRALVVTRHDEAFAADVLGCMAAGVAAIPLPPPVAPEARSRWHHVVEDARPDVLLSASPMGIDGAPFPLAMDADAAHTGGSTEFDPERVAIVQYTSGSTGRARGVLIDGFNLSAQQRSLRDVFAHTPKSRVLTWLPVHHDMGLIGGLLHPIYAGIECVWLAPSTFLASALSWLRAISHYRATTSGAPNFAYEACVKAAEGVALDGLDLSSWSNAFNGSEMVHPATLERFRLRFAPFGFRAAAEMPCYGLAEATLMATAPRARRGTICRVDAGALSHGRVVLRDGGVGLVSTGAPLPGTLLAIVDPATGLPMPPDRTGEVVLQGPGISRGYLGGQAVERFALRIGSGERPWMKTGDLGFVVDGELYLTGRLDDALTVRGRKLPAEDIERSALEVLAADVPAMAAAFGVPGQAGEKLVLLVESAETNVPGHHAQAIAERISRDHGIAVEAIDVIAPRMLPRTTSGKLKRGLARERWVAGLLGGIRIWPRARGDAAEAASSDRLGDAVLASFRTVLSSRVCMDSNFFAEGGDSLRIHALRNELSMRTGMSVELADVFEAPTPAALRGLLAAREGSGQRAGTDLDVGILSPAQRRIWFAEHLHVGFPFYHVGLSMDVGHATDADIQVAVDALVDAEPALRTRFFTVSGEPRQRTEASLDVPVAVTDVEPNSLAGAIVDEVCAGFDLTRGVVRARVVRTPDGTARLVLTVHHIVCDGWGARRIAERLTGRVASAGAVDPPTVLADEYLRYYARRAAQAGQARAAGLAFFRNLFAGVGDIALPLDFDRPRRLQMHGGRCRRRIDAIGFARMAHVAADFDSTPFLLMLAGLAAMIRCFSDQGDAVLGTVVSPPPAARLGASVSCDINFLPLRIHASGETTLAQWGEHVRDTFAAAVRHSVTAFDDLVQELNPDRQRRGNPLYGVGLWFNDPAATAGFPCVEVVETSTCELDLRFIVTPLADGGADVVLEYATELFMPATARRLLDGFLHAVNALTDVPATTLSAFASELGALVPRAGCRLALAANFTVEPALDTVGYWSRRLELPVTVDIAPYDQVEAQLLRPGMRWLAESDERIVVLDPDAWSGGPTGNGRIEAFVQLARSMSPSPKMTLMVTPASAGDGSRARELDDARAALFSLRDAPAWTVVDLSSLSESYGAGVPRSPYVDELGRQPFTEAWLAALGTTLFRRARCRSRQPRKVLVLDCDGTLWDGECASSIDVPPHKQSLQDAVLRLRGKGAVLALCTRNRLEDVESAFADRRMRISLDDLAAVEASWDPKSQSLQRLADRLGVGMDTLVLIDDDPAICAEIRAHAAEVCVVTLPVSPSLQSHLPAHLWEFDGLGGTAVDGLRASAYAAETQRQRVRLAMPDIASFVASLGVKVNVRAAAAADAARIAQLTQRSNQFNASDFRTDEASVLRTLDIWRVAEVSDRFGDYGLTGAACLVAGSDAFRVEAFVLSCRVLGREVEGKFMAALQVEAAKAGWSELQVAQRGTARNTPARAFLDALQPARFDELRGYTVMAVGARAMPVDPVRELPRQARWTAGTPAVAGVPVPIDERRDAPLIVAAGQASIARRMVRQPVYVAPDTMMEKRLAQILADVLQVDRVGVTDDFFELGGYSLLALRAVWRIRDEFGVSVTLADFHDRPTVAGLADAIVDALVSLDGTYALSGLIHDEEAGA